MSCLVHPLGWRLYFSKYWKSNFFISKKRYLLAFFSTKLLFEIILSILNRYYFKSWKRTGLKFSSFKIFLNLDTFYILINYKFYWKNLYTSLRYYNFEKLAFKGKRHELNIRKKNKFFAVFKKKHISVFKSSQIPNRFVFFFNSNPSGQRSSNIHYSLVKNITSFFYLIPHFIFIKKLISMLMYKVIPSLPNTKIFFSGLNYRTFNPKDLLDLAEYYLRIRSKPAFVFYRLIKIMKGYKKAQKLKGFKVLLTGRFSRRDRATFLWRTIKRISLGSRLSGVSYFTRPLVLNYSKCAIKIWICQS